MKCATCQAELNPNQKFCGKCGKRVEIDDSKLRKCNNCGICIKLTDTFCTDCGTPVEEEKICGENKQDELDAGKDNKNLNAGKDGINSNLDVVNAQKDGKNLYANVENGGKDDKKLNANVENGGKDEKNLNVNVENAGKDDKNFNTDVVEEGKNDVDLEKAGKEEMKEETQHVNFYEPPPDIPEDPSVIKVEKPEEQKRGLALICAHSKFVQKGHSLSKRPSAPDDLYMMREQWSLYGCQIIDHLDADSDYYNNGLVKEVEAELKKLDDIEIFVFVLSTHGEERESGDIHKEDHEYEHYFFTKDGQCKTQDIMDKIAGIRKLNNKLKIFIIQACRSRASGINEDQAFEMETTSQQVQLQDGTDRADAQGIPAEEDKQDEGVDRPDAKGYMPPPEEDETASTPQATESISYACSSRPFSEPSQPEVTPDMEPKEETLTLPEEDSIKETIDAVPHCDDSIVMFASMSGKFAYSKSNSVLSGGWLIKAIEKVLKQHKDEEKLHILDVMTEVNREVGMKEVQDTRAVSEMIKLMEDVKITEDASNDELKEQLNCHVKRLKEIRENNLFKVEIRNFGNNLNSIGEQIIQADTKDSLLKVINEVVTLTEKFQAELSSVTLKAQSNFLHNLAFDDEKLYLHKSKSENS